MYLIFTKIQWQQERETKALGFNWTDEELDSADEKGYIGTKFGIDCYISRNILNN